MSNEPKHTATPWRVDQDGDIQTVDVYFDTEPILIATVIQIEDAARIVYCVNEYDGLIETIESLRAENAELIEALREIKKTFWQKQYVLNTASQTLAKYEKP